MVKSCIFKKGFYLEKNYCFLRAFVWSFLLADTTMCFKENHPSMATIETVPLNGGACGGKYSINDMKKKGYLLMILK